MKYENKALYLDPNDRNRPKEVKTEQIIVKHVQEVKEHIKKLEKVLKDE